MAQKQCLGYFFTSRMNPQAHEISLWHRSIPGLSIIFSYGMRRCKEFIKLWKILWIDVQSLGKGA